MARTELELARDTFIDMIFVPTAFPTNDSPNYIKYLDCLRKAGLTETIELRQCWAASNIMLAMLAINGNFSVPNNMEEWLYKAVGYEANQLYLKQGMGADRAHQLAVEFMRTVKYLVFECRKKLGNDENVIIEAIFPQMLMDNIGLRQNVDFEKVKVFVQTYTNESHKANKSGDKFPSAETMAKVYFAGAMMIFGENKNSYASKANVGNRNNTPRKSSGGCYIATCVYGSYDCPEVWVLRRYRDYVLAKSYLGRKFIKLYYLISPKLVDVLGNYSVVRKVWACPLNVMVKRLKKIGYSDKPYID